MGSIHALESAAGYATAMKAAHVFCLLAACTAPAVPADSADSADAADRLYELTIGGISG